MGKVSAGAPAGRPAPVRHDGRVAQRHPLHVTNVVVTHHLPEDRSTEDEN